MMAKVSLTSNEALVRQSQRLLCWPACHVRRLLHLPRTVCDEPSTLVLELGAFPAPTLLSGLDGVNVSGALCCALGFSVRLLPIAAWCESSSSKAQSSPHRF